MQSNPFDAPALCRLPALQGQGAIDRPEGDETIGIDLAGCPRADVILAQTLQRPIKRRSRGDLLDKPHRSAAAAAPMPPTMPVGYQPGTAPVSPPNIAIATRHSTSIPTRSASIAIAPVT